MSGKTLGYALMGVAMVLVVLGQTLISQGMKRVGNGSIGWTHLPAIATNPHILAGLALMLAYIGVFAAVLGLGDLSLMVPLTAASYPLGTAMARFYLGEQVGPWRWAGTAVITVGVLIAGLGDHFGD